MRRHHPATAIAFVFLFGLLSVAVQSIANAQEEDRSDWPSSIQTGFAINDLAATAWAVTSDADLTQRPIAATFWAADETPHPKLEKFSRANPRWRVQTVQAEFLVTEIAGLEAGSTSEVAVYLTSGAQDRLDLTAWAQAGPTEKVQVIATSRARYNPPSALRSLLPYALTSAAVIGMFLLFYAIGRVRNRPKAKPGLKRRHKRRRR